MSKKILISGFEPFGGRNINISWETARQISQVPEWAESVEVVKLPVSFKRGPEAIRKAIARTRPSVVLMLGLASKRDKITVERLAVNIKDAKRSSAHPGVAFIHLPAMDMEEAFKAVSAVVDFFLHSY